MIGRFLEFQYLTILTKNFQLHYYFTVTIRCFLYSIIFLAHNSNTLQIKEGICCNDHHSCINVKRWRKKDTSSGKRIMVPVIGRMTHADELMPLTFIYSQSNRPTRSFSCCMSKLLATWAQKDTVSMMCKL